MDDRPLIAITLGDPAGIGPEIVVKTLEHAQIYKDCRPVIIGSAASLEEANLQVGGSLAINLLDDLDGVEGRPAIVDLLEPAPLAMDEFDMGKVSAACGKAAVAYIERGISLAASGQVAALVTCPIHKEAIQLAGYHGDIGHQEILARTTDSQDLAVMLMTQGLKVVHLSTHKPLGEAVAYVKRPVIVQRLQLTAETVHRWGMKKPKIAVAALNPHKKPRPVSKRPHTRDIQESVPRHCLQHLPDRHLHPAQVDCERSAAGNCAFRANAAPRF